MHGMLFQAKINEKFWPSTFRFGPPTLNALAPALTQLYADEYTTTCYATIFKLLLILIGNRKVIDVCTFFSETWDYSSSIID